MSSSTLCWLTTVCVPACLLSQRSCYTPLVARQYFIILSVSCSKKFTTLYVYSSRTNWRYARLFLHLHDWCLMWICCNSEMTIRLLNLNHLWRWPSLIALTDWMKCRVHFNEQLSFCTQHCKEYVLHYYKFLKFKKSFLELLTSKYLLVTTLFNCRLV